MFLVVVVIVITTLGLATSHANIASYANTAALLSDQLAQRCALRQSWELLRAEDGERYRLDGQSLRDVCALLDLAVLGRLRVQIL